MTSSPSSSKTASAPDSFFTATLAEADPEIAAAIKGELGRLRAGDRDAVITALVEGAVPVDGVALVVSEVPGEDPGGLRDLAQKVRDQLSDRAAAIVVGNGEGGKAMLVAAVTGPAVERGVTAPAILATAATVIGGGAGGKDILANAGGKHPERVSDALCGIPARLEELLGAR